MMCPGSGQRAQEGMGRPICPVCHRTSQAGLPSKGSRKHNIKNLIVPVHAERKP